MDVLSLRVALETLLTDQLGNYVLPNGMTTTAISVRAVGEGLPIGQTVNGLELVVVRDPELTPVRQYRQEQTLSRWTVYLIDWSGSLPIKEAADRIICAFPNSTVQSINVPKGVGPSSQMRIDIPSNPDQVVTC